MKRNPNIKKGKLIIPEKAFTAQVIELARRLGWRCAHFRPAMTQRGRWITAVQGDGAGFPDLVLVRGEKLLFVELKTEAGKLSPKQMDWAAAIQLTPARYYLWRPSDWRQYEAVLR